MNDMKYKNPFQNKNDLLIVPWKEALDSKEQKIRRAQSFTPAKEERAFYSQIPSCPAPTENWLQMEGELMMKEDE